MKDGICPKCDSKEIYIVDGSRTGVTIPIGTLSTSASDAYLLHVPIADTSKFT